LPLEKNATEAVKSQGDSMSLLKAIPAPVFGELPSDRLDKILRMAILASLAMILYACIVSDAFEPWTQIIERHEWAAFIVRPSAIWLATGITLLLFRTLLWYRYRPMPPATPEDAPLLTVIIPAYNEGAMVAQTIESVAAAHYPRERLEIIAVDDGSVDNTWHYIQCAAARHPSLVSTVHFGKNQGKRAALEAGFRRARGEILVTIDSDSVIEPEALLAITGPFRDPRIGAVAGRVGVLNRQDGLIPRMLHVRFILSFDFLRAAQSVFRTVYCTPGALSAYRAEVVRRVLDRWLHQTFLGVRSDIGEDRALTNYILEQGYDTVYQRSACVHTTVPETYGQLCKMYTRWDRSFLREEWRFARIVWTRPWRWRVIALVDTLVNNLRYPVIYASMGLLVLGIAEDPETLLRILFAIGLMALLYTLYYLRSQRSLDFVYGIAYSYFAFFALTWIFPYAVLTVRTRGWLTR
jgi:hyaluronan synthase